MARLQIDPSTQAGAEAQVAALSDDIAYVNHDLHDGLRAGLFGDDKAATLPLVGPCYAEVDRRYPRIDPVRRRHEAMRRVFGLMVEDVLQESGRRLAETAPGAPDGVRALSAPVVDFSTAMWADVRRIKEFLFARMYRHFRVKRMRVKADAVVRDLFGIFHGDPSLLPDGWREAACAAEDPRQRARVVGDYIAGMTDRFALEEHRALTDPAARA
jgi:dGTPase